MDKPTGEIQPERDAADREQSEYHGGDGEPTLDRADPQPFTPLTPFGDAKPWAGSVLDPGSAGGEAGAPTEDADRPTD